MVGKYKVITLCGSTRFKEEYLAAQKQLTLEGNIVISVGLFGHAGDDEAWSEGTKEMLDDMHKRKIDLADEIFVINAGGYLGDSTRREIAYAEATGKTVRYLEEPNPCSVPGNPVNHSAPVDYAQIAQALAKDYSVLYYVNLETDDYIEFNLHKIQGQMVEERHGTGFFTDSIDQIRATIFPGDLQAFDEAFDKNIVIEGLRQFGTFSRTYRIWMDTEYRYVHLKATCLDDAQKYMVVGFSDGDVLMKRKEAYEQMKAEKRIFSRIGALSGNYLCIYTVDPERDSYIEYRVPKEQEKTEPPREGEDFFNCFVRQQTDLIFSEDAATFQAAFQKDRILEKIRQTGIFVLDYRMMVRGVPKYVRLKATMAKEDRETHLIVGILDIDDRMRQEQEYDRNLASARAQARQDALTGVRNKQAYVDFEEQLNQRIREGDPAAFAVGVFDVNGLKQVNDTQGHQVGDQYIRQACEIVCRIFSHSPVFRVGGDEFAVIAQEEDYEHMEELLEKMAEVNRENAANGGPVIACGAARSGNADDVASVFRKADYAMYENKKKYKETFQKDTEK